mgnify:CR=1 FL=1
MHQLLNIRCTRLFSITAGQIAKDKSEFKDLEEKEEMIITIMTWIVMLSIFGIYGIAINILIKKIAKYEGCNLFDSCWFGITVITVYAQFFSLFYKVGKLALLFVTIGALFLIVLCRKEYLKVVREILDKIQTNKDIARLLVFSILIFAGGGYLQSKNQPTMIHIFTTHKIYGGLKNMELC